MYVPNFYRVPHIRSPSHQDDLDDSRGGGANGHQTATNGQTPMLTIATATTTTSNAPNGGGDSRVVVTMVNNGDKR